MWFYLSIAVLAGICATLVILSLAKRNSAGSSEDASAQRQPTEDVAFYQRQLAEIQRDVTSGTLSAEDAERTKTEVSRRLLEADKRAQSAPKNITAPKGVTYAACAFVVALLFGGGAYLYNDLGSAGRPDYPLANRYDEASEIYENRISQAEAEKREPDRSVAISDEDLALINQLRTALEQRPTDEVGHRLLAKQEAKLGNFTAARLAQSRVVELAGAEKAETGDLIILARIMAYGANGYISPQAEAIWGEILRRNPDYPEARYYMGLMFAQTKRPDLTYNLWAPLWDTADDREPWVESFRMQFPDIAYFAGKPSPEQNAVSGAGPNAEQMALAAEMTPEEREEMILGMVENLADKLEDGNASAQEWAQYIRANSVLGKDDVAKEAFEKAAKIFAGSESDTALISQSGIEAGIIQGIDG